MRGLMFFGVSKLTEEDETRNLRKNIRVFKFGSRFYIFGLDLSPFLNFVGNEVGVALRRERGDKL